MKKNDITYKPLEMEYVTNGRDAVVELKTAQANKYLGYPSTYAKCMSQSEYLTDTANMSSLKGAGACAAQMEKMQEKDLDTEESNIFQGYPEMGIPPRAQTQKTGPGTTVTLPRTTLSSENAATDEDCPCAKEETKVQVDSRLARHAEEVSIEASASEEKKQVANLVPYQRGTDFVQYAPEVKKEVEKNLKESEVSKKWWIEPDAELHARDYSKYLKPDITAFAQKTKKQWEKIDKKELKRDTKKEKGEHEKDAVKDDKSKIKNLDKGKPSEKKSVEKHDLKKDEKEDKKTLKKDTAKDTTDKNERGPGTGSG